LARETNDDVLPSLAEDLVSVVDRLERSEAAKLCGQAAALLADSVAI
jgi:hypothetical protein